MIYPHIETLILNDCKENKHFNSENNLLRLEHYVSLSWIKHCESDDQYISEQRIKDLVLRILDIKTKQELEQVQENMMNINKGNAISHIEKLNKLKTIYSFNDDDLIKLSCWLTQVKRTAYNMELKSPSALVFYSSKKCTGKSTLMTMIKKAVLSSYQTNVHLRNFSLEQIFSRFNPVELIYDLVVSIDEIGWMSKDISANFKTLITETNEIPIEKKYKDAFYGRKVANFIITTNDDPADLFFSDAHERRLSVIENFQKIENMKEDELYMVVNDIWQSAPVEYAFDTNKLMEMNLNRVRSNDEIFEALLKYYETTFDLTGLTMSKGAYTITKLYNEFRELKYEIPKKLIKSYLETTPEYFRVSVSDRVRRYYMSDKLINDLKASSNINDAEAA